MYRVMIVDDELWILRGLERLVDWETYGFEIVAVSTDSAESLRAFEQYNPHLLISDIRMAGLNGIELMKRTLEMDKQLKHIMISGYSEFEYAREALRYGALDYLIKPITKDALSEALHKVKAVLDYAKPSISTQPDNDIESIVHFLKSTLPIGTEGITLNKLGLKGVHNSYRCVMIPGGNDFQTMIKEFPSQTEVSRFSIEQKHTLLIVNVPDQHDETILQLLHTNAREAGVSFGVSDKVNHVLWIPDAIGQARSAYYNYFIDSKTHLHLYINEQLPILKLLINELDVLLPELPNHSDKIQSLVDQIPAFFHRHQLSITSLVMVFNHIIGHLNTIRMTSNTVADDMLTVVDCARLVREFTDMDDMLMFLHENVQSVSWELTGIVVPDSNAYHSNKAVISRVKQYIDQNYKMNITLTHLAEKFHIDERYLSQLFKQEIGKNFINYLTTMRINNARSLLKHTDLSIQSISELCGYNDYFYFNKVFKKGVGMTPSSYRYDKTESV